MQKIKQQLNKLANPKTYLITGAAGFIGFSLAKRLLEDGHTVVGVDIFNNYYDVRLKHARTKILKEHKTYVLYKVDICNMKKMEAIIKAHPIDVIVHLAAQAGVRYSYEFPLTYLKNNIEGTVTLFELARLHRITKVIYASSSSVYGDMPSPHHEKETSTDNPISMYAATKKSTELCAHAYAHAYGMTMVGLRFFTVYGPWSRPDMAMLKFANAIIKNDPVTLYGKGKLKRSFTYIDDIIDGIIKASLLKRGNYVINLGGGESIEVAHLVSLLEKGLNKKAKRVSKPVPKGDVKETNASQEMALKYLKFKPKVSFEHGVQKFCEWFLKHQDFITSLDKPKQ